MASTGRREPNRHDRARIAAAILARLSPRQREISVWATAGFSSEQIAKHLGITSEELRVELEELARAFGA